ncbi:hypothetical protein [Tsukamurella soli]
MPAAGFGTREPKSAPDVATSVDAVRANGLQPADDAMRSTVSTASTGIA